MVTDFKYLLLLNSEIKTQLLREALRLIPQTFPFISILSGCLSSTAPSSLNFFFTFLDVLRCNSAAFLYQMLVFQRIYTNKLALRRINFTVSTSISIKKVSILSIINKIYLLFK